MSQDILEGKIALVTGAGRGIGKAIAECLSRAGASVVVAELDPKTGDETASLIEKETGNPVVFVQTDVTKSESIKAMIDATVAKFGRLDIAVNNAGVPADTTPIASLDEDLWTKIMATNLTGVALSLKWELKQMVEQGQGGCILNMASGTVFRPQHGMAAYVAAKHGVVSLTQTAAFENGQHKIRVNALAPGGVVTDMMAAWLDATGLTEESQATRTNLFGRFAKPHEVGQAAVWMVSDGAAHMTGVTLPLDAGMSIK